ncbi:MAG: orotate phosphoribosyltransferase [Candidatus Cloacimonetes bacterium]|nr:orotate phosphoribosyltransferase [Candidatus Cloacimonadota bacterium]
MFVDIKEILKESGAFLEGHFQLTSGRHSQYYIEKIKVINQPDKVVLLCKAFAEKLKHFEVDFIIGPAMGGIVLAFETARQLGKPFVFSQRKDGEMTIRSGFEVKAGQKAIIIEDIVTTGGSVREVLAVLKQKGVESVALGLIVDRTGGEIDFGIPTFPLLSMKVESWEPEDCPLCRKSIALTRPGSSDKK